MASEVGECGKGYPTEIEGATFLICTEREPDEKEAGLLGRWRAWSFFAYDETRRIYPADAVPENLQTQESIAGASGTTESEARQAVEQKLRKAILNACLDGTGFYSPPAGRTYPQEFPDAM
jgi:hypothetical protein